MTTNKNSFQQNRAVLDEFKSRPKKKKRGEKKRKETIFTISIKVMNRRNLEKHHTQEDIKRRGKTSFKQKKEKKKFEAHRARV